MKTEQLSLFPTKPFHQQFKECKMAGMTRHRQRFLLSEHPEMLPFDRTLTKKMLENKESVELIQCGRFGGTCSSGNEKCKELRKQFA